MKAQELTETVVRRLRENRDTVSVDVVALFCEVSPNTVHGWLRGSNPLGGLTTLRLWHLLNELRIDSPELRKVHNNYPFGGYLGRLLAFDAVQITALRELFKSSKIDGESVKENAIYRACRNESKLVTDMSLEDLEAKYAGDLETAYGMLDPEIIEAFRKAQEADQETSVTQVAAPAVAQPVITTPPLEQPAQPVVTSDDSIRTGLVHELAKEIVHGNVAINMAIAALTADERDLLRKSVGPKTLYELSANATWLSSERLMQRGE